MKQILTGLTDEQTLSFTDKLADIQRMKDNNLITDANRAQVLAEAQHSAELYAKARNKNASARSLIGASAQEQELIDSVRSWVEQRKSHLRGKR